MSDRWVVEVTIGLVTRCAIRAGHPRDHDGRSRYARCERACASPINRSATSSRASGARSDSEAPRTRRIRFVIARVATRSGSQKNRRGTGSPLVRRVPIGRGPLPSWDETQERRSLRAGYRTAANARKPPLRDLFWPAGCSRHRHPDAPSRGECGMREVDCGGRLPCSQYLGDMTAGPTVGRVRPGAPAPAGGGAGAPLPRSRRALDRPDRCTTRSLAGDSQAYFYDPTGEKARAVKARCQGVCRGAARTRSRGTERTPSRTARRSLRGDRAALDARARAGSAAPGGPATGWWTSTSATLIRLRRRTSPSGSLFQIVPCGRGP